ncbi:D123-domain-containing protein [Paraphysoderma sedebokerense]|nr:D123-domain-containing protein [Paraphysoderma sedebokerense]
MNEFPVITRSDVLNCSFSAWYDKFKGHTIKSRIVKPLSNEFIQYLLADGVMLPLDPNGNQQQPYVTEIDDSSETNVDWDEDDDEAPSFPDLEHQIEAAIRELGGAVFPKMNWSSPKDASWITLGSTLKCQNSVDIFLLLKSSDFIVHDLEHAFDSTTEVESEAQSSEGLEYELVLRKWYELSPSMEFRCFIRDHVLLAISQRDSSNYYSFLQEIRDDIESAISEFFLRQVRGKFSNANYVFDVYVNRSTLKVVIVDFNPFSVETDALLYSWPEILQMSTAPCRPLLRIVESQMEASQSTAPAFTANRLPMDVIDLSNGRDIADFAKRFDEELRLAADLNRNKS